MDILIIRVPIIERSPLACIYRIRFGMGLFYIGSTIDFNERVNSHANNMKNGSKKLQEYTTLLAGKYSVTFEIIEIIDDLRILNEREQYYLDQNINNPKCLNVVKKATLNRVVKAVVETGTIEASAS